MISDVHIQCQCHVIRPAKLLIHSIPESQIVLGQELDWSMWVVRDRLRSPEMSYKIHKQLRESRGTYHSVAIQPYQSSSNQKINCLKATDSCVVRLIFRYDPVVRFSKFLCQPKIHELYFHLSYLRAESVSGARRTSWIFCIAEVYPPIHILNWHLRIGSQLRSATQL